MLQFMGLSRKIVGTCGRDKSEVQPHIITAVFAIRVQFRKINPFL